MNKHWQMDIDADNIVWLGFNRQDSAVNTIDDMVLDELNSVLQEVAQNTAAIGLVIYSLKKKGFIAGADIHAFSKFDSPTRVSNFLRKGQTVFSRLEELNIPTIAMIDGFCFGGGLEMALACDYRIASEDSSTKLGLPEVMLGIHPGWGGTVRLPRLIGGFQALSQVILTGASLLAKKAKALGFVDEVVPKRQLKRAVVHYIKNKPPKHKPSFWGTLSNYAWIRPLVAKLLRREVSKKINKEYYPAPFAIIDQWEKECSFDERAYLKEADSVEQLVVKSDTTGNLIRLFLLRERLKSFAKASDFSVKQVHVIGAGVMGGDIAAWCAFSGFKVTLQDQTPEKIAPAIRRAHELMSKKLRVPRLVEAAMDRLIPDIDGNGIQRADVIIEAVFENLEVKRTIMKQVEFLAKPDAIIATNTSSIPLDEINNAMMNPERLVGIHFFNPVAKMELVEVVTSSKTTAEIAEKACSFVGAINRLPLPVKSSPGFLINRVLMPYLLDALRLMQEGYTAETIDHAAESFGMVMGPVELADTVGIDVCLAVAENLTSQFGGDVPQRLRDLAQAGTLGRKTGQGFYRYKNGKPIKQKVTDTSVAQELSRRLISKMTQEAKACLQEKVVLDADLLDAGMIFGTGFAPFRGGPARYAATVRE